MAKLYFYYAAMNAGKSTTLIQADFNYRERGMETMLWTAAHDDRSGAGTIGSRVALSAPAQTFSPDVDLFAATAEELKKPQARLRADRRGAIPHPRSRAAIVPDQRRGRHSRALLRPPHRFPGQLFEGSAALLALADSLIELKAVCECGRKATMNLRVDAEGHAVAAGAQTEIGGNDRYVALCRRHFFERLEEGEARQLSLGLARTQP